MDIEDDINIDINGIEEKDVDNHFKIIDVSVQQRNNRKCWTVISNLVLDKEKKVEFISKAKKKFSCSGAVDENNNIRFTGDHKNVIVELMVKELNLSLDNIRVH